MMQEFIESLDWIIYSDSFNDIIALYCTVEKCIHVQVLLMI